MNRNEAIAAARAAGYTHVATAWGWVRLQDWTPYGTTKDAPTWASRDFPDFTVVDDPERPRIVDQPVPRTHRPAEGRDEKNLGVWPLKKEIV